MKNMIKRLVDIHCSPSPILFTFFLALGFAGTALAASVDVSTYAKLKEAILDTSVDVINVTANIEVPCAKDDDFMSTTAALQIDRNLTIQGKDAVQKTIKRTGSTDATGNGSYLNRSILEIYGNGTYDGVTVILRNIIFDGGAVWASGSTPQTRSEARTAHEGYSQESSKMYGKSTLNTGVAGRSVIDVANKATLNLEGGVVVQNGECTNNARTGTALDEDNKTNVYGGGIRVECYKDFGGGTINVKSGAVVQDCVASNYGGAIGAYNLARINVYGGTIRRCSAIMGGGIGVTWADDSYDPSTAGKAASKTHAGVISTSGGTIEECWAKNYGAALVIEGTAVDCDGDEYYKYSRILGLNAKKCVAGSKGAAVAVNEGSNTTIYLAKSPAVTATDCDGDGNYTDQDYTVSSCIYKSDGSVIEKITSIHKVSFVDGAVQYGQVEVEHGRSAGAMFPADPARTGMVFTEWRTNLLDSASKITKDTVINSDVTAYAYWVSVKVSFDSATVPNTTYQVFLKDLPITPDSTGKYYVPSNEQNIVVVYTANSGYYFADGTTAKTNSIITSTNPATVQTPLPTAPTQHQHCICGTGKCAVGGHSHDDPARIWTAWTATDSLPTTAGDWFLANDVTLTAEYKPVNGVNLCLNGHTVTQTTSGKRVISVVSTSSMTDHAFALTDCVQTGMITGGTITGSNNYGSGINVATNSSVASGKSVFKYYGGIICGNTATSVANNGSGCGGGVCVNSECEFYMYGGVISNNTATSIDNYTGTGRGGGLFVSGTGKAFVYGGDICYNSANRYGGGVEIGSGGSSVKPTMTFGGKARVFGNKGGCGGGICCDTGSQLMVTGGEIFGNEAKDDYLSGGDKGKGGGLYLYEGPHTISNCVIRNNRASVHGGGICHEATKAVTIGGTLVVTNNTVGGVLENAWLATGETFVLSSLASDSKIGVTLQTAPAKGSKTAFTTNGATSDLAKFTSDDSKYNVVYDTDHLALEYPDIVYVEVKAPSPAMEHATFKVLTNGVEIAKTGDKWLVISNTAPVQVVYEADSDWYFSNRVAAVTNTVDATKNPVIDANQPEAPLQYVQIIPETVPNTTYKVYLEDKEITPPPYYVPSNAAPVKIVYEADSGFYFPGGNTSKTNELESSATATDPVTLPAAPAAPMPPIKYVAPVYKGTDNNPTNGIAYWVTNTVYGSIAVMPSTSAVEWKGESAPIWYVVTNDVTIVGGVACLGDVKLILCDGARLTVNAVDEVAGIAATDPDDDGSSFTVYAQEKGTGALEVTGGERSAAIGGNKESPKSGKNITLNGGSVTAYGGKWAAAIGGGNSGDGVNIVINGGTVKAIAGELAAAIGGGQGGAAEGLVINGGTIAVLGNPYSDLIGSGKLGDESTDVLIAPTANILFSVCGETDPLTTDVEGFVVMTPMTQSVDRVLVTGFDDSTTWNTFALTNLETGAAGSLAVNGHDRYFAARFLSLTNDASSLVLKSVEAVEIIPEEVSNTTYKVYRGDEELMPPPYLVPINETPVTIVYTPDDGYTFPDGTTAKTNAVDTSTNPATVLGDLPAAPVIFVEVKEPDPEMKHTTFKVFTNGVEITKINDKWLVVSNTAPVEVVYEADPTWYYTNRVAAITNTVDATVNPVIDANQPLDPEQYVQIIPEELTNTTYKVYLDDKEITPPPYYVPSNAAPVKIVYETIPGHYFPDGTTTKTNTLELTATGNDPASPLPTKPAAPVLGVVKVTTASSTIYYETLAPAFDSIGVGGTGTVTMIRDLALAETGAAWVPDDSDIVFDLNGKKIDWTTSNGDSLIYFAEGTDGKLKIKDSAYGGTITSWCTSPEVTNSAIIVYCAGDGDLTVDSGRFVCSNQIGAATLFFKNGNGDWAFNGGLYSAFSEGAGNADFLYCCAATGTTVIAGDRFSIVATHAAASGIGASDASTEKITIRGGDFDIVSAGSWYGAFTAGNGTLIAKGGDFEVSSTGDGVSCFSAERNGTTIISNGTFHAETTSGYAYAASAKGNAKLVIAGGTLSADAVTDTCATVIAKENSTVTIVRSPTIVQPTGSAWNLAVQTIGAHLDFSGYTGDNFAQFATFKDATYGESYVKGDLSLVDNGTIFDGYFSSRPEAAWVQDGKYPLHNTNAATMVEYPWTVGIVVTYTPPEIPNTIATVCTNGVPMEIAEPYMLPTNVTDVTVIYTPKPGYTFPDGTTAKTNDVDTTVNPATTKGTLPSAAVMFVEVKEPDPEMKHTTFKVFTNGVEITKINDKWLVVSNTAPVEVVYEADPTWYYTNRVAAITNIVDATVDPVIDANQPLDPEQYVQIIPEEVDNTTYKVYWNDKEITPPPYYVPSNASPVKIVYETDPGYNFPDGSTVKTNTLEFTATGNDPASPLPELPPEPVIFVEVKEPNPEMTNTTFTVLTNGVEISKINGKWLVVSNTAPVEVVYTADPDWYYTNRVSAITNKVDATVNPVIDANQPLDPEQYVQIIPEEVENTTYKVFWNDKEITPPPYYVPSNASPVKIVYEPKPGYIFPDGMTVKTNELEWTATGNDPASPLPTPPPAGAFIITNQTTLTQALNALKKKPHVGDWYIGADFTVTTSTEAYLDGFDLIIRGNGYTLTGAQNGTLQKGVFTFRSQGTSAAKLRVQDLDIVVSNGYRYAFNLLRKGDSTTERPIEASFDNVGVTMAHSEAQRDNGGNVKSCAAVINNYCDLMLTNGCSFTANTNCYCAIDVTSKTGYDASLTIASDDITFVDNRLPSKIAAEPLVIQSDKDGGTVTITGIEKTPLKWVDLANNHGYSYVVEFTPEAVDNTTSKVYVADKEVPGVPYLVPSNASPVTVVYKTDDGYVFPDGETVKTNALDTSTSPATIVGEVPQAGAFRIYSQATLDQAVNLLNHAEDCSKISWYIDADFTITKKTLIAKRGVELTVFGNDHVLTAEQDGDFLDYVFDFDAVYADSASVDLKDFNLVVGKGFRNGLEIEWDSAKGKVGYVMRVTLDNVDVTMARTEAPFKTGAAIINRNGMLFFTNACTFVADEWTRSAIDMVTDNDLNTYYAVQSDEVVFVDNRTPATIAVEPLVKIENTGSGCVMGVDMERTGLKYVELQNGIGYSYVVEFTPTPLANTTNRVFAAEKEIPGVPYLVPSNGVPVYVRYEPLDGFEFPDHEPWKTNSIDTTTNPASMIGDLPQAPSVFIEVKGPTPPVENTTFKVLVNGVEVEPFYDRYLVPTNQTGVTVVYVADEGFYFSNHVSAVTNDVVSTATDPATLSPAPAAPVRYVQIIPEEFDNTTYKVYLGDEELTPPPYYVPSNASPVKIVYIPDDGYTFPDGTTAKTNEFNTAKDPAEMIGTIPTPVECHVHSGVVFRRAIATIADLEALCASGGNGYLVADLAVTSGVTEVIKINADVKLCLAGHAFIADGRSFSGVYPITLTYYDCTNEVSRLVTGDFEWPGYRIEGPGVFTSDADPSLLVTTNGYHAFSNADGTWAAALAWPVAFDPNNASLPGRQPLPVVTNYAKRGEPIAKPSPDPADPMENLADRKAFDGWYTNAACTADAAWDFAQPVTGDLTLYAKWISNPKAMVINDENTGDSIPAKDFKDAVEKSSDGGFIVTIDETPTQEVDKELIILTDDKSRLDNVTPGEGLVKTNSGEAVVAIGKLLGDMTVVMRDRKPSVVEVAKPASKDPDAWQTLTNLASVITQSGTLDALTEVTKTNFVNEARGAFENPNAVEIVTVTVNLKVTPKDVRTDDYFYTMYGYDAQPVAKIVAFTNGVQETVREGIELHVGNELLAGAWFQITLPCAYMTPRCVIHRLSDGSLDEYLPGTGAKGEKTFAYDAIASVVRLWVQENSEFYVYGVNPAPEKIVFEAMGGVFADGTGSASISGLGLTGYALPAADPTRKGYSFLGWYDSVTNGAALKHNGDAITSKTLYAKWQSASTSLLEGTLKTPDDGGAFNAHPTNFYPTGVITIPERLENGPNGHAVVSIANYAFTPANYEELGAPAITDVTIPGLVQVIGKEAFRGNQALTNVTFSPVYDYMTGEKTELYIRNLAFAECALTNLVFPAGGNYRLGHLAFVRNPQLKDVWILGDVTVESLENGPFREVGEACGGTTFHLSAKAFADAELVFALTNGIKMVSVCQVSDLPEGRVEIADFAVGADEIVVNFTLSADSPWKTVNEDTVSLLFSGDPAKLVVGDCAKLPAMKVVKLGTLWQATFAKPISSTGFFTVCIGD